MLKKCIGVLVLILLMNGCAVIKGMHEDKLEAAKALKPKATVNQAQVAVSGRPAPASSPSSRNATETAGKMLSPIVQ